MLPKLLVVTPFPIHKPTKILRHESSGNHAITLIWRRIVDYYCIHDEDQTHYRLYTNVSYNLNCHCCILITILNYIRVRSRWLCLRLSRLGQSHKYVGSRCSKRSAEYEQARLCSHLITTFPFCIYTPLFGVPCTLRPMRSYECSWAYYLIIFVEYDFFPLLKTTT